MDTPYMTPREAAEYLRVTLPALRRLVAARAVPFCRITQRTMRFRQPELERALEKFTVRAMK